MNEFMIITHPFISSNCFDVFCYKASVSVFNREKIMTTPRKEKKRESRREEKAEKAAVLEKVLYSGSH